MLLAWVVKLWNLWPPFFGAGIRLQVVRSNLLGLEVRLKGRPWTRNPMGTQFGGSIFAMTDPFYVGIFRLHLPREIQIWDKAATIRFRRASRGELRAVFRVTPEQLEEIQARLALENTVDWTATVNVLDLNGQLVAEVEKTLAFRRRPY
ncbi:MAG: DUF4442 domain-containing protein [Hydrogenophaga sp.]|jgi:acyl-coenzyme A thioesterase PaaI-like protein|nr:DUF4442 domain-containing protein [Hydrogenophaga sp.]